MKKSYSKQLSNFTLHCDIIKMGFDYAITLYNDIGAHIGSVVMSVARESLTGNGISATSSVLNRMGHKDDIVAMKFAKAIAIKKNCCAVCSCGIHLSNATNEQIEDILKACDELLIEICIDI